MKTTEIRIVVYEYQNLQELSEKDRELLLAARKVSCNAYAPYSKFNVGAAVLLANGEIVTGNNQENSAYPSGMCAERVALFYANAQYPNVEVQAIAITAEKKGTLVDETVTPCGSCRQALAEAENRFGKPIRVILDGNGSILMLNGIESLLPLSFSKEALK